MLIKEDDARKGETVKSFDAHQSFDLLVQLLGDDWKSLQQERLMEAAEVDAAHGFLNRLEGLGLAIQQAAVLIKDERVGGPTIEGTYELFKKRAQELPDRQYGRRSSTYHSLDTLWDMSFRLLPPDARVLLSCLAFLSPGKHHLPLLS